MKVDLFTFTEKLLARDDGFNPQVQAARDLLLRGKIDEALAILAKLPDAILACGCLVAGPTRGSLVPDQSAIPDEIKDSRKKSAPKSEEKKK